MDRSAIIGKGLSRSLLLADLHKANHSHDAIRAYDRSPEETDPTYVKAATPRNVMTERDGVSGGDGCPTGCQRISLPVPDMWDPH
jgi:hypothetical protein